LLLNYQMNFTAILKIVQVHACIASKPV